MDIYAYESPISIGESRGTVQYHTSPCVAESTMPIGMISNPVSPAASPAAIVAAARTG